MADPKGGLRMSLTDYSKRVGASKMAVSRAVTSGRLKDSVIRDPDGRPWIVDVDVADREWGQVDRSRAPDYVKARDAVPTEGPPAVAIEDAALSGAAFSRGGRPAGNPSTLSEASAQEKHWRAKTAELKFRERAGELVEAHAIGEEIAATFAACRTKLLGLPSRAKQNVPDLPLEAINVLDRICREICDELATPERFKRSAPTVQ